MEKNDIKSERIKQFQKYALDISDKIFERRKPLFIEFSGTPKSGKTTALKNLDLFLRRNGFKVHIVRERAEHCPIPPKNHIYFNAWTFCSTMCSMLEGYHADTDVVLIDRGVFDSLIWFTWMKNTGRIDPEEMGTIEKFLLLKRWDNLMDIIFLLKTSVDVSLKREYDDLFTDIPGPIMNKNVLLQYNVAFQEVSEKYKDKFKYLEIFDTSTSTIFSTGKEITHLTLESLDMALDEKIGIVKRDEIGKYLSGSNLCVVGKDFITQLSQKLQYVSRSEAEFSNLHLQPIPCAIFEYDGNLLVLKRKEHNAKDRMHDTLNLWAGGHIRKEDGETGNAILNCLYREIDEELFIRTSYDRPQEPLGIVYSEQHEKSRIHFGIVYRINLQKPEIAIGLETEFKERRGLSLSGRFLSPEELVEHWGDIEPWSRIIIEQIYKIKPPKSKEDFAQRIFDFAL